MIKQLYANVTRVVIRTITPGLNSPGDVIRRSHKSQQPFNTNSSIDLNLDDSDLRDHKEILRGLEAEIYALTDQFETEQDLSGVSAA